MKTPSHLPVKLSKRDRAFLLLEVIISAAILAVATAGIIGLFLTAERRAMFSMLQHRVAEALRQEVELTLADPYEDVADFSTNVVLLLPQGADTNDTNVGYRLNVQRVVYRFSPTSSPPEPEFKIVNHVGVWRLRGIEYTNIVQTVVTP